MAGDRFFLIPMQIASMLAYAVFFITSLLYLRPLFARASSARRRPGVAAIIALSTGALAAACVVAGLAIVWTNEPVGFGLFVAAACAGLIAYVASVVTLESMRSSLTRVGREIAVAHRRAAPPGETLGAPPPNTPVP